MIAAVITARNGSASRMKDKNLVEVHGKPLVA